MVQIQDESRSIEASLCAETALTSTDAASVKLTGVRWSCSGLTPIQHMNTAHSMALRCIRSIRRCWSIACSNGIALTASKVAAGLLRSGGRAPEQSVQSSTSYNASTQLLTFLSAGQASRPAQQAWQDGAHLPLDKSLVVRSAHGDACEAAAGCLRYQ